MHQFFCRRRDDGEREGGREQSLRVTGVKLLLLPAKLGTLGSAHTTDCLAIVSKSHQTVESGQNSDIVTILPFNFHKEDLSPCDYFALVPRYSLNILFLQYFHILNYGVKNEFIMMTEETLESKRTMFCGICNLYWPVSTITPIQELLGKSWQMNRDPLQ